MAAVPVALDRVIVPQVEELEIEDGGLVCEVEGCNGVFSGSSQLRMHMEKHHRRKSLGQKRGSSLYCCPVSTCDRRRGGRGKPFPRLGQLKQHYQRVHAEKKYSCERCGKQFSLHDVFARHQTECGQTISCRTCGAKFLSKNALYKHARRKSHNQTTSSTSQQATKTPPAKLLLPGSPSLPSLATCGPPSSLVQIVVKQVVKLSKSVSVAVQTEGQVDRGDEMAMQEARGMAGTAVSPSKRGSHEEYSSTLPQSSSCLDFSTQTEDEFQGSLHSSFDFSDLATQTDFSELLNFSMKSTSCQTCLLAPGEDLAHYLQTSSDQSSDDSILRGTVDSAIRSSSPFQQSSGLSLGLECAGTQTTLAGTGSSERLVMGTQTTPAGTGSSERLVMGTQTTLSGIHPEMLVMGTQTVQAGTGPSEGLVMGTQTSPEDWFCPMSGDSRIDFGTQTVDWLTDMADLLPPPSFTARLSDDYHSTPKTQHP